MIFSGHHRYIPEVLPIHTIHVQGQVLFTDLKCIIDQGQGHTQEVTENENAHTHGQGVVVTIETDIADLVQEVHIIKDDQEGLEAEAEGDDTHQEGRDTIVVITEVEVDHQTIGESHTEIHHPCQTEEDIKETGITQRHHHV